MKTTHLVATSCCLLLGSLGGNLMADSQTPAPALASTAATTTTSAPTDSNLCKFQEKGKHTAKIIHFNLANQSNEAIHFEAVNLTQHVCLVNSPSDPIAHIESGKTYNFSANYWWLTDTIGMKLVSPAESLTENSQETFWEFVCHHHVFGKWTCEATKDSNPVAAKCSDKDDVWTCNINLVAGKPSPLSTKASFKVMNESLSNDKTSTIDRTTDNSGMTKTDNFFTYNGER